MDGFALHLANMVFRALEIWSQEIIERSHSDGDRFGYYVASVSLVSVFVFTLVFTLLPNMRIGYIRQNPFIWFS